MKLPQIAVLYLLLLFCGGEVRVLSSYASIVLCFLFSLAFVRRGEPLLTAGLAFTVAADTCLVLCDPQRQLLGMGFFLVTQTLYAVHLHRGAKPWLLYARVGLIVAAEALTVAVLRENTDLLAVVSLAYYANLILNILTAATKGKSFRLHMGIDFPDAGSSSGGFAGSQKSRGAGFLHLAGRPANSVSLGSRPCGKIADG